MLGNSYGADNIYCAVSYHNFLVMYISFLGNYLNMVSPKKRYFSSKSKITGKFSKSFFLSSEGNPPYIFLGHFNDDSRKMIDTFTS